MNRQRFSFALATCLAAAIALAVSRVARAAEPPSPPTAPAPAKTVQSLDDQLLQGLDNQLLGNIDDKPYQKAATQAAPTEKTPRETAPTQKTPAAKSSGRTAPAEKSSPLVDPLDEQLSNSLTGGEDLGSPGEDSKNPLARIVVEMRQVQQRLAESKSDNLTQREQQRISDELKSLVDQLVQQQQQQQRQAGQSDSQKTSTAKPKSGNAPPGKSPANSADSPARNSSTKLRPNHTERPDPALASDAAVKQLDRLHLPEKDRELMQQAPPDVFLPGHESSIEQYFQRLVEQEEERP
jgi:hypothetical protein